MNVNLSRNQVLITCSTDEEAKKLTDIITPLPEDSLDDLLGETPRLRERIATLEKANDKLSDEGYKKDKKILDLGIELDGLKFGSVDEKPTRKVKKSKN